jgi:hypothetical protein
MSLWASLDHSVQALLELKLIKASLKQMHIKILEQTSCLNNTLSMDMTLRWHRERTPLRSELL